MNRRNFFVAGAVSLMAAASAADAAIVHPLRLCSSDENDPGHTTWCHVRYKYDVRVFLNGREVEGIGLADEAEGFVEGLHEVIGGTITYRDGDFVIGRVYGNVRIELRSKT